MLALKPINFLATAKSVRDAVDDYAELKAKIKEFEALSEVLKTRLIEVSALRKEDTILGNKFKMIITTEFQDRIDTKKLRASLSLETLAVFTNRIKIVKATTAPLIDLV